MSDLTTLQFFIGMAILVLGPTSGVWIDMRRQVSTVVKRLDEDRVDTRNWLKSLEIKTNQNAIAIAVTDAILKDRAERAEP